MFVVPTKSYAGHVHSINSAYGYVVLGPFPAGVVLRRVRIQISVLAEVANAWLGGGLVIVGTDAATAANFQTGLSVIQRSPYTFLLKPGFRFFTATMGAGEMTIDMGIQVQSSGRYLLGAIQSSDAAANVFGLFSVEVVRLVEVQFTGPTF